MSNHREIMKTISLIILLVITTFISLGHCAPAFAKSLAPIWLSNDSSNGDQRGNIGSWNKKSTFDTTTNPEIKSDAPLIRHISSLSMKKDSYMGREWSAGNLPFSILYVNTQRVAHSPSDSNKSKNTKRPTESGATAIKQQNNRQQTRNRGAGQTRRQYSIIPELFMSYGWGRLGK